MKAYKINTATPPAFVFIQDFTIGVLGYWVKIENDTYKISNGDFVLTDEIDNPKQYLPAQTSSNPLLFQEYKEVAGKQLIVTIWKTLNQSALTDAVKASILQTVSPVLIACICGEIRAARIIANGTATTTDFTAARKTALLNMIDDTINNQL